MRVSIFLLTVCVLALSAQLPAQRMSCAHADSVARLESLSRDDRELAVAKLLYCPDIRAAAITSLLRRGEFTPASDTLGRMAAWALFDPALVDSMAALAKDSRQPRQRRALFVSLLTRYADCGRSADITAIDRPRDIVLVGGSIHSCGSDNRHPLPAADRDRARAAIAWLASHGSDVRVRSFAAQVSRELTELWAAGLQTPSSPR